MINYICKYKILSILSIVVLLTISTYLILDANGSIWLDNLKTSLIDANTPRVEKIDGKDTIINGVISQISDSIMQIQTKDSYYDVKLTDKIAIVGPDSQNLSVKELKKGDKIEVRLNQSIYLSHQPFEAEHIIIQK